MPSDERPPSNKAGSQKGGSKKSGSNRSEQESLEPDEKEYRRVLGSSRVSNDSRPGSQPPKKQPSSQSSQGKPGPHTSHVGSLLGKEVSQGSAGSGIDYEDEPQSSSEDPPAPRLAGKHGGPKTKSSQSSSGSSSGGLIIKKRVYTLDDPRHSDQAAPDPVQRLRGLPTATESTRGRDRGQGPPVLDSRSSSGSSIKYDAKEHSDESRYKNEPPDHPCKAHIEGKPREGRSFTDEELEAMNRKSYIGPSTSPPSPLKVRKMSLKIPAPAQPTTMPTDIKQCMIAELKDYRRILTHAFQHAAYFSSKNGWLAKALSPNNNHLPLPPEEGTLDYNMPRNFANNVLEKVYTYELVSEYDAYISERRKKNGYYLKRLAEDDAQANDELPMQRESSKYPDWESAELNGFITWVMRRPYGKMRSESNEIMLKKGCNERDAQRIWREQQIKRKAKAMDHFPSLSGPGASSS